MSTQVMDTAVLQFQEALPPQEDLVRTLVAQLSDQTTSSQANTLPVAPAAEEVLMDIDVDGERYLLIRMPRAERPRVQLSPREQEIVRMVAEGHPNKIIADVLSISSWTVCTHLRRIFAKLGVGSRAAMVARLMDTPRPRPLQAERKSAAAAR
jgi:two-component system, NarL family, nitrate/nitrite response regulator NarL